jgi:hypothetical protein
LFEVALALAIRGALLMFQATGKFFRGFARSHAEFGKIVRHWEKITGEDFSFC